MRLYNQNEFCLKNAVLTLCAMTSQALRRSGSAQIIQTHFKRKNMHTSNINDALPADLTAEAFEDILRAPG